MKGVDELRVLDMNKYTIGLDLILILNLPGQYRWMLSQVIMLHPLFSNMRML